MTNAIRRGCAVLAIAVLTVTAVVGCGTGEADFERQDAEQAEQDRTDGEGNTEGAPDPEPAEDEGVQVFHEPYTPDTAIATMTKEIASPDAGGTVLIGVQSLTLDGEVMVLDLSFTPEFEHGDQFPMSVFFGAYEYRPRLIDRVNLKQYHRLEHNPESGSGSTWDSGMGAASTRMQSGATLRYWAYFAAPEDDIDTVTVRLAEGVEFEDIPIDR